jgi:hypothetical protein|tara:strand:- start:10142 stop:10363 length:222 start_codon:yes stop_codon:yes gene_type:complete
MATYKVITNADQTQAYGRVFNWKKMSMSKDGQVQMEDAYNLGLTDFVEKIKEVKPEVKKVVVKKDKKDDLNTL